MSKLINCKTCNAEIAASAKKCPSCGAKNKKPIYKKWWMWLIILLLAFILIGSLGSGEKDKDSNTDSTPQSETTDNNKTDDTKEFYSVGEEVKLGDNILIINSVEKSNGSEWDKPKDGNEFVIVSVTIKNGGSSEISYNPFDFKMQNSQGQITDQAFTTINNDTSLSSGKLAAGGSVSGSIAFEQPTGDSALVLKYKSNIFSNKEIQVKLD
ncbi:MAG: DUF4352 domain-containing protein [Clostridium sp.]|nr:DUF4352 domain-containing protein [Clostridium sp.]